MRVEYSDLPGFQNLFLDYINKYENVEKFFPKNFKNNDDYLKTFTELENFSRPHRNEISKIIKKQYSDFNISKQTESHITALASEKTFAVVTAESVGLFGGSMNTIYKAITTIKLANLLNEKYNDYNFVPIFWMNTDEHNFEKSASANILDANNIYTTLLYDDGLDEETNRGPVGNIVFNSNIKLTLSDLEDALPNNEFRGEILQLLNKCYKEGGSFKDAFKKLLFNLFDEYGLIIFDPQDSAVKNLLLPIFEKEIENFTIHTTTNVLRSAELEEVYHAEVKVNPINIFYSDESGRHLIEPVEDEFRFRGKRKKLNKEALLNLLYFDPTMFSPGVLLNPVCQSFLLPTVVYIGSESEVNCFAQVVPNYSFFNVVQPILFPRSSATIIESSFFSIIKKYGLSLSDFTFDENILIEKVIKRISKFDFEEMFSETELEIKNRLNSLTTNLLSVDSSLIQSIEKSISIIDNALLTLKEKSRNAETQKHQEAIDELQNIRNIVFPNNRLQERELNFISFAGRYGLDIIKWITAELKTNLIEHQILEL